MTKPVGPVQLLALSPVPAEGAGCRFRVLQYVPALERAGFSVTVAPFFDAAFFDIVYRPGHLAQKLSALMRQSLERLARASWIGSLADRAAAAIGREWRRSRSRAAVLALGGLLMPSPPAATVRVAGWTITVASATTLILNAIKPASPGPLSWVVPAVVGVAGVLLMAASAPLGRAYDDRRLRTTRS